MAELCEEVETVRVFCYLGNNSRGCKAALTARARIGWVKFKEYGELLNSEDEWISLSELCKISNIIWE